MRKFINFFSVFLLLSTNIFLMSCGGFKPADARKTPTSGIERAQKNVREGRGVSLRDFGKPKSTTYEFSTSNPMWRATFDVIDFMPLTTVDYSGGLIITDWYTDDRAPNESLKFTIRFLSSDVRADSLKIIIHRKICKERSQCVVKKISSKLEDEIRTAIIRKAALLQKVAKEGKKEGKKKAKKGIFGSGDSLDEIRARDRKTKRDSGQ